MQIERTGDLIDRGLLTIGDGYRAKRTELAAEGLPFARAANINDGFRFDDAEILGWEGVRRAGPKLSEPGDVVFTSKGTVGRFALVEARTPRFAYSPQLCYWRSLAPDVLLPQFLYYWMNGPGFREQVGAVKGQTDMAEYVNLRDQRRMFLPVPEPKEQRRIAGVLGALDDKIEANRRMNASLDTLARAVFRERFGRYAPGDALPAGWRWASLDFIADYLNGVACQKYPAVPGEPSLPVIKIRELRGGISDATDRATLAVPAKYHVRNGDVLFSWSGTLDARVWSGGPGALNQHLFKVTSSEYPAWFYFYWILHHLDGFRGIAADKATTMGHIKRHHLTDARVVVPSAEALRDAADATDPLFQRQHLNEIQSASLAALRDELLPKLLSGEVHVRDAEATITAAT